MANKKSIGLGMAAVAAAGAGAALAAKTLQKKANVGLEPGETVEEGEQNGAEVSGDGKRHGRKYTELDYRNTELGRYDKNSKGIYYSNGNYEAFAKPKKPEGVDEKNAYIAVSYTHLTLPTK